MKKKIFTPKIVLISLFIASLTNSSSFAQLAKCKGKYMGNIIQGSVGLNYNTYWNQATSENGSKWGSVEGSQGNYDWTTSDVAYNWAKNNNAIFKYHNFVWGSQKPNWVAGASTATLTAAVENYIKACSTHYTPMGGIKMIDVVNEPVNTSLGTDNYKAALTAGYQAEPANAADKNNQYGWIIWSYQLARKYFPNATLLINEYNVEHDWNSCRAPYIAMVNAVKNAPNITDGKKNLIDGVGLQCHGVDNLSAANFKACIDQIWNSTGVPIHITEFDQAADPNEAAQTTVYSTLIPVAWEHPHVAGITIWGYIQGTTWIKGNGTTGANGTDSGIMYASGVERPALTWLKTYMASQTSLSCCPAPGPFASCANGASPTVSITSPAENATFAIGANIAITATAADADGTVSKVEFYNGNTKLGEATTSPFTYNWIDVPEGAYTITAVATDNSTNVTTSMPIDIVVGNPLINLISNGEFDNSTAGWSLQLNNSTTGTMTVATDAAMSGTNSLRICPTSAGNADWNVQVSQTVGIVLGQSYQVSFLGKADLARTITTSVQQGGSPYKTYLAQPTSLTTASQLFTYTFTADTTDASALLKFFVGNNTSCVNIDNVIMKKTGVVADLENNSKANDWQTFNIYPNPFQSALTVETKGQFSYLVMNQLGQVMESGNANNVATIASHLNKGVYFVSIENNFGKTTRKVVKE